MVHPKTRQRIGIREDILATLRQLQPHALALNAQLAMDEIERTAGRDSNHASYLRRRYAETGSVQGVVRASVDALRQGPG